MSTQDKREITPSNTVLTVGEEQFHVIGERVALTPFYNESELETGVIFTLLGEAKNQVNGFDYFTVLDYHMQEERQLYKTQALETLISCKEDKGKMFAVKQVGRVQLSGNKEFRKFKVIEIKSITKSSSGLPF